MARRTGLVIAIGVGLGAAWLARRGGDDGRVTAAEAPAPRPAPAAPSPAPRPVELGALDPAMLSAASMREALEAYQRDSVYPPTSHAYTDDDLDRFDEWNRPIASDLPLDDRPGSETMFRFASDRHHVGAGEALTSTIEIWPAARPHERLPAVIRSAVVVSASRGRTGVALDYRDDGAGGDAIAGDHVYTNRFVPSARPELARAERVRVQAIVDAGGVTRPMTLDFTYAPRPLLTLVDVHAAPAGGSLAIALDLDVHEPGAYLFACDVLSASGEPIGWITAPWQELARGRRRVDLSLFGRVLRDRGLAGPYVIHGVRAMRRADDDAVEQWWSDPREITTDAFPLDDFSDAVWDDEERRAVVATMERSIAEEEAAERGQQ